MAIFSFIRYTLPELFGKIDNLRQLYKQTSSTYRSNEMSITLGIKKKKFTLTNSVLIMIFNKFQQLIIMLYYDTQQLNNFAINFARATLISKKFL